MEFGALMRNLPGLVYRCRNERAWTLEYCSPGAHTLTGFTPEELIGPGWPTLGDLIVEDDRDRVWTRVQAAVESQQPFQLEYRLRTREGIRPLGLGTRLCPGHRP
ncbi:MAG: PAS domain-containing protein [Acidimicrobiia bacterium]|nr:PAS domain-containing protein [Acidimicrobiia bacterium]